jgi:multiple sugar transport system permease protein
VEWLSNPDTALLSLVAVILTISIGQPVILFSAAIGTIPEEYYEAATVDGASNWQKLMKITIPCLMPTMLYVFVISTINAFQTFVPVYVLTGGGPQKSTSTVVYELYEQAFRNSNFGYASAIGMILFLTISVFAFFQFKLMYNRK